MPFEQYRNWFSLKLCLVTNIINNNNDNININNNHNSNNDNTNADSSKLIHNNKR